MSCHLKPTYDNDIWASKTTQAEEDCVEWVKNNIHLLPNQSKLLDIGIGTSHCYKELCTLFQEIHGITVMESEIVEALKLGYLGADYRVRIANKHNSNQFVQQVDCDYSAIIDVNLKMFTCCEQHWLDYFHTLLMLLAPGGYIVSSTAGFGQYNSPVYGGIMGETLTIEELTNLASLAGLVVELFPSPRILNHSIVIIK